MATSVEAPPRAHPARQKALEQFVTKLREWNRTSAGHERLERQARITVGSRTVILEPWERQQLSDWFAGDESATPAARYLLAHGAALQLKCAFDIERVTRAGDDTSSAMYALQAELMLDTAIGMALLKDIQCTNDKLVKTGQFEDARCLTQFRHRLARVVNDAKMCIAEAEREQAESIAVTLTDHPDAAPARAQPSLTAPVASASAVPQVAILQAPEAPGEVVTSDVAEPTPKRTLIPIIGPDGNVLTEVRRRPRPKAPRRAQAQTPAVGYGPSLTQILTVLCALAFGAWFAVTQVKNAIGTGPVVLTRADFADDLPISAIESHAPSVYVTIEAEDWDALSSDARLALIQELGRSASRRDFAGLLLRSDSGVPLARWLSTRGASEIVGDEDGQDVAPPPGPEPIVEFEIVGSGQ